MMESVYCWRSIDLESDTGSLYPLVVVILKTITEILNSKNDQKSKHFEYVDMDYVFIDLL